MQSPEGQLPTVYVIASERCRWQARRSGTTVVTIAAATLAATLVVSIPYWHSLGPSFDPSLEITSFYDGT